MKIFVSLLFTSLIFIFSCDTNVDPNYGDQLNKKNKPSKDDETIISTLDYELIPLPGRSPIFLDSVFTITKTIFGEIGGQILLDRTYISDQGNLVTLLVNLSIPPNAFSGQRKITLTVDKDLAIVHCLPAMVFNFPLRLVQTFSGLDLQNYKTEEIDFVYIKQNGTIEEVDRSAIVVNKLLGMVSVIDAELNHFSRYGWVRKDQ